MTILLGIATSIVTLAFGIFMGKLSLTAEKVFDMEGGALVFNRIFTYLFYLSGIGGVVIGILMACGIFGN